MAALSFAIDERKVNAPGIEEKGRSSVYWNN